ncbi:protein kinase C delta type-like [Brachyhypopomus gauderio]|uniref:protein kinase C delta type-like n=1 Tax=Brachyhypopomus gauderio TaxID=698409 RepID=UPI004041D720
MSKWKDIKMWYCWCCGGIQDDSDDADTESRRVKKKERIKKKKRKNNIEPKQETDNTHGLIATLNKSVLDEACEEHLHCLLDEIEDSCSRPLETPVNKSALDDACQELPHVLPDETEDTDNPSLEEPLNNSVLVEACEEHLHVPHDEIEDSCSQPPEALVNKSALGEACQELPHVVPDKTEETDNPSLDASPYGQLCEASSSRPPSQISHQTRITLEQFTFRYLLGKGGYGKVFLAELKGSEACFAVKAMKKIKRNKVLKDRDVEFIMVEKRVLALAWENPFLTHLYATFQTKEHLFFVMEYVSGGNLMFNMKMSGCFDLDRATFYAAEIVCGLQFLHGKGIIHRDLKLRNVMLDGEGHVKIADFGLCKENVFGRKLAKSICGTLYYMAPEMLQGRRYSFSVDWWSFGVLVYAMLIGKPPFHGDDDEKIVESILMDTPHFPQEITVDTRNMLERLFQRDPYNRLGVIGNIRGQPFFKNINWSALERREIDPPYKPKLTSPKDCSNFDIKFLCQRPLLSQCEEDLVDSMDQSAFAGFSFINQHMEPLLWK